MTLPAPRYPYPITSYAVILGVCIMHIYEAIVILKTTCADLNIPIHALLGAIPFREPLAIWLIVASLPAMWSLWKENYSALITCVLVVPQGLLLLVTAKGAYIAFWSASYVNFNPGCPDFIGTDQLLRVMMPFFYAAAVYQKVRESAFNSQLHE